MGDCANVKLVYGGSHSPIFLYTHWAGYCLPETVQAALVRGQDRWGDEQYLGRIIFCEMVKGDFKGNTGYGISPFCGDGDDRIVEVDIPNQRVRIERLSLDCSFAEFVKLGLDTGIEDSF